MDYSKLSDQEINMAVAGILHPDSVVIESKSRPPSACITGHLPSLWVDYCSNPADAWPIIQSNGISLVKYEHGMWLASSDAYWVDGVEWQIDGEAHPRPLRAAMIVFLKMQESANVQDNPA